MKNKVIINEKHTFQLEQQNGEWCINGESLALDIQALEDGSYHIIFDNNCYLAESISRPDGPGKTIQFRMNGMLYKAELKDSYDLALEALGIPLPAGQPENTLVAPMPGLVLDIVVSVGEQVSKNDPLITLEAMKMENLIKSPGPGRIKSIPVTRGQAVEKGQTLLTFE